jgi:hypothetical protein
MSSNAYQKGYQDGYQAAIKGNGKSYVGMGKGILSLNFSNYSSQYSTGYDEGYLQGLKDKR